MTNVERDPKALVPFPDNPRTHPKKQIRFLQDSITRFGATNPAIIDEGDTILAGHARIPQDAYPYEAPGWKIVQSWDTAMVSNETADWSVCTTWLVVNDCFYLTEVFRQRLVYPDLKAAILRLRKDYTPDHLIIEDKGAGTSLLQDFRRSDIEVEAYRCSDPKEVRAGRASLAVNQGRLFIDERSDPVIEQFLEEVMAFPGGRHDDQVDSMVQMIDWWKQFRTPPALLFGV